MKHKRIGAEALPKIRPEYRMKRWRSQRVRRGFADCDLWNVDSYLLSVIPGMLRLFADGACGYPEQFWSFEKGRYVANDSYEVWATELKRVADAFDYYASTYDQFKRTPAEDEAMRMKLFVWLGHNIMTIWD